VTDFNTENTATLFRNQKKTTDRHPDHTGQAEVKCPHCGKSSQFWLAAWVKTARKGGSKFFSLAFTSKDDQANKQREKNFNDFDDDPPF